MLRRYSCIYKARMSLTFNRSSVIRHFKHSDVIERRDGVTFDFYTRLSHVFSIFMVTCFCYNYNVCCSGNVASNASVPYHLASFPGFCHCLVFDHLQCAKTEGEGLGNLSARENLLLPQMSITVNSCLVV